MPLPHPPSGEVLTQAIRLLPREMRPVANCWRFSNPNHTSFEGLLPQGCPESERQWARLIDAISGAYEWERNALKHIATLEDALGDPDDDPALTPEDREWLKRGGPTDF